MKKFICLLTFLLSISLVGCSEESNQDFHMSQGVEIIYSEKTNQDFYMSTDVEFIYNGEQTLVPEITFTYTDIQKLLPKQYQQDKILTVPKSFNGEGMYCCTSNNSIAQDLFYFNFYTFELKHIADVSSLKMNIYSILEVNGSLYFYGDNFKDTIYSNSLFLLDENGPILLSDTYLTGPVKYDDGLVAVEHNNSLWGIVKYTGTTKTVILKITDEYFPNFLLKGPHLSWISSDSSNNNYFNVLINGEHKKFRTHTVSVYPMTNTYAYIEVDLDGKDILYIKNYMGEEIASFEGDRLDIYSTNDDDIFLYVDKGEYKSSDERIVTQVAIDNENSTITISKLNNEFESIYSHTLLRNNYLYLDGDANEFSLFNLT